MTTDVFIPERKTLGQILSNTSPPIKVPQYQRDYSWEKQHVKDFWEDVIAFSEQYPGAAINNRQYFLGASVLVNNNNYHLLLDGQQRFSTATILLAAIRDKIHEHNRNAANQIQGEYISFVNELTGSRDEKLELNVFDQDFFRAYIQTWPRPAEDPEATKKSHRRIISTYEFFAERIQALWDSAGGGQTGFDSLSRIVIVLANHVSVVTVTSTDEANAATIFGTLNDRGIGLSIADLLRSWILQRTNQTMLNQVIGQWDDVFESCGNNESPQTIIRYSWVSQYGDVKDRALYKVIRGKLESEGTSSLDYSSKLKLDAGFYQKLRKGDTDDSSEREDWLAINTLNARAGYSLMIAAKNHLDPDQQNQLLRALLALSIRHNIVCRQDRSNFETVIYDAAKQVSAGTSIDAVLDRLRELSPSDEQFKLSFPMLTFTSRNHNIAQYLLRKIEYRMRATGEDVIAPNIRVHVEHIYPQTPQEGNKWDNHDRYVRRIGNLTLLDQRLNITIKNSTFDVKKEAAYKDSRIQLTSDLIANDNWTPVELEARQQFLMEQALVIWPESLI